MVEGAPSQFSRTPYNLQFAKISGVWGGAGPLPPTSASALGLCLGVGLCPSKHSVYWCWWFGGQPPSSRLRPSFLMWDPSLAT